MFLFILESIGTSELILIGIIALIFLGPRKLPEIARKIGKTMAEFRSTTNEFKSTWEREVNFEEEAQALRTGDLPAGEPSPIPRTEPLTANTIATPEIKPVQPDMFNMPPVENEISENSEVGDNTPDDHLDDVSEKKNWL